MTTTGRAPKVRIPTGEWPTIDRIEHRQLCHTLRSDVRLFTSLIVRMLSEYSGLEAPGVPLDAAALDELGRRMHKLKGSAGTLGALGISRAASDAEQACIAGDATAAVDHVKSVVQQLSALRASFAAVPPTAVAAPEVARPQASAPSSLSDKSVEKVRLFIAQLQSNDLGASEQFCTIADDLAASMDATAFAQLSSRLAALEFGDAAEMLLVVLDRHWQAAVA